MFGLGSKRSIIREIFEYSKMRSAEIGADKVFDFSLGNPSVPAPAEVNATIKELLDTQSSVLLHGYSSAQGDAGVRGVISDSIKSRFCVDMSPNLIYMTCGAAASLSICLKAVIEEDKGDECIVFAPFFTEYRVFVENAGGKLVISKPVDKTLEADVKDLESRINEKTKAIIFPYPNNPTGGIMEREYIEKIIPIILEHDLLVISDEIYSELTYGTNHISIASFDEMKDRVVLISGFSKAFAMTGWRIGFVCAPKEILSAMLKIHQYTTICAPIFSQYAALAGLKNGKADGYSSVNEMRSEYDRRRRFMIKAFADMGLECFEPKGSFYIFPSVKSTGLTGEEFATKLLESKKVAVVPGDAFGEFGKYYVRCSYAYSMKNLMEATERIAQFVKELKN
jgi:aminotransferase